MRSVPTYTAMVALAVALAGCQQPRQRPYSQIKVGQTGSEVIALIGAPDTQSPTRWRYERAVVDKTLVIPMEDGQVASKPGFEPPNVPTP